MLRRPYGPTAWWVEDVDDPAGWADAVRRLDDGADPAGIVDVIPAETTVVVRCTASAHDRIGDALDHVTPAPSRARSEAVEIDVHYDGPDLAEVAERTGLDAAAVVARHAAGTYHVGFCGFSPGFAYLLGLDAALHLPRRDRPRTTVPAGSVAIAAHYTAVYPSASPGGWHLIGRTDTPVWDLTAPTPALLRPGTPVRFRPA